MVNHIRTRALVYLILLLLAGLTLACDAGSPDADDAIYLPVVTSARSDLSAVNDFLYQLQNLDLTAVGNTAYDLIVMDYSADGGDETAYTTAQIAALEQSPGGDKIVLAYMSIGEAENYRFYWQAGWQPGNPAWLDAENPNWAGNYKVHYWDPDWQTIVFDYTDRLLEAGFDGAYLDIVDAYEYYAEQGRAIAAQEMADFVTAIRAHARARNPGFFIFPQNAAELAGMVPGYLDSVDGIGQEDIYYGYDDDDRPTPPDVTAELESNLDRFRNAGKLVLTVDYATTPAHVDDAYAKSQAQGYVPFVTVRNLDQLTINPGHEPESTPPPETATALPAPGVSPAKPVVDKWALWVDGPHLRGANIYQRRVYPELDGPDFMGPGPIGPPYTQQDFDRLAALGANYVNISHPGLFAEKPPYTLDQSIQDNLDSLLGLIAQADMFAVIGFRTGPGRSEFTFHLEDVGDWFDESYLDDAVWQDQAAQDAWAAMWRYTAERYRDHPIVAGYDLMVEPNANEVGPDVWEPDVFYRDYGGTLYDWNQLYPRITAAIREKDSNTPILIGGTGYSAIEWLSYLRPTGDPRTVYTVHQYAPTQYTHQAPALLGGLKFTYPGRFDTDWDGSDDLFDRAWLEDLLSTVDTFATTHGAPVAANEFGLMRWQPGAAEFMDDQIDLFEQRGMNYALWVWDPAWEPWTEEVNAFNFCHGPDPDRHADVASSDLIDVIVKYWRRNTIRPRSQYPD